MLKNQIFNFGLKQVLKFSLLFTLLSSSSCAMLNNNPNEPTRIRIVDLNGNPRPVKKFVPEGNAQILASQNNAAAQNVAPQTAPTGSAPVVSYANRNLSQNNLEPVYSADQQAVAPVQNEQQPATISYDMSNDVAEEPVKAAPATASNKKFKLASQSKALVAKATKSSSKSNSKGSAKGSGIFVQIASYGSDQIANETLEKNNKISTGTIEEVNIKGREAYRVLLGPIDNQNKANQVLKQAKNAGYHDAFIVR